MSATNPFPKYRVGIFGASGRSGSHALTKIAKFSEFELGAAVVSNASELLGKQIALGLKYEALTEDTFHKADGWIDFSTPEGSISLLEKCSKHGIPVVVATTGFTEDQRKEIAKFSISCPILLAPNTSIGIFALRESSKLVKQILGDNFDIEIVESHHRGKKDAPSGTALMLAKHLCNAESKIVTDRAANSSPRGNTDIGVASLRGGDIAAEHTIYFIGNGQQIELIHRARDRAIFAEGALHLLNILREKGYGLYELSKHFFGV